MAMPITIRRRLDQFQDRGFIVRYNLKGDGNCQFSAVSYLLNRLWQNVVGYLRRNPAMLANFGIICRQVLGDLSS